MKKLAVSLNTTEVQISLQGYRFVSYLVRNPVDKFSCDSALMFILESFSASTKVLYL